MNLQNTDPEIAEQIKNEINRQKNTLAMIASENLASQAVLEAGGSVLTNKYSEGYPFKKYYQGNRFASICEDLAIKRAKKLFGSEHANVQPHCGSSANMAAYFALTDWLKTGEKILAMSLDQGGHLSHGSSVNFSGKLFEIAFYHVDPKTHVLDYEAIRKAAKEFKPNIIVSGATAYPRKIDFEKFKKIADEVGAFHVADIAHIAGLIAAGCHQSAVPFAQVVTSTTHKTLRGPRGGLILCQKQWAGAIDKVIFPGLQGGPLEHIIAGKAICFKEAMEPGFIDYQKQIVKNAKALAQELTAQGLTLLTGGTDNHLVLLDVSKIGLGGQRAGEILEEAGIVVNKNMIPFDKRTAWDPSGLRIGTPALTTRGMKEPEMKIVGELIANVLLNPEDEGIRRKTKTKVQELCDAFPLYQDI